MLTDTKLLFTKINILGNDTVESKSGLTWNMQLFNVLKKEGFALLLHLNSVLYLHIETYV